MPLYSTEPGFEALKRKERELSDLVMVSGFEVGEAAGMNCDWHDNAGFDEARRALEFNSRRLQDVRAALREVVLITLNEQANSVRIGSTVKVTTIDVDGNEERREFTIGAYAETDAKLGLIAYDSPMASALMGQQVGGETLEGVRVGNKVLDITINEILPPSARYTSLISQFYGVDE